MNSLCSMTLIAASFATQGLEKEKQQTKPDFFLKKTGPLTSPTLLEEACDHPTPTCSPWGKFSAFFFPGPSNKLFGCCMLFWLLLPFPFVVYFFRSIPFVFLWSFKQTCWLFCTDSFSCGNFLRSISFAFFFCRNCELGIRFGFLFLDGFLCIFEWFERSDAV